LYLGNVENPHLILIKIKGKPIDIYTCGVHSDTKFICDYAFYNCYNLEEVTISDSVVTIGSHAFDGCTQLQGLFLFWG
jgi:hypothetical protein